MAEDQGSCYHLDESDIEYEVKLLKNRKDKQSWSDYISHKQIQLIENSSDDMANTYKKSLLMLYFRQYLAFDSDFEVWTQFIDYYIRIIKQVKCKEDNIDAIKTEINLLSNQFQTVVDEFGNKLFFWIKYLRVLISFIPLVENDFIINLFEDALSRFKPSDHLQLWRILLNEFFNNSEVTLENTVLTGLYYRYFKYLKNCHFFDLTGLIEESNDFLTLGDMYHKFIELLDSNTIKFFSDTIFGEFQDPFIILRISDSEVTIFKMYFEKLIDLSEKNPENSFFRTKIRELYNVIVEKFSDQKSLFTIKLAEYYFRMSKQDKAFELLDNELKNTLTIKDFTFIFDRFTALLESYIENLINEGKTEEITETYMNKLEGLYSERPLLVNDVKLRQNANSPNSWLERINLLIESSKPNSEVFECFSACVLKINMKKTANEEKLTLANIWCLYAEKLYELGNDLVSCRKIYETATKVPWTEIEQLELVWLNWIKFEIRISNGNLNHALTVSSKSVSIPNQISSGKINIEDGDLSVQMKIFKSIKLWSLYLDLVENVHAHNFDLICERYEECIQLKIVNGVILINYCLFLEENNYIEKSFSVFERGMKLFQGIESKTILYSIYLTKILKYWAKLNWDEERVREIFEQGLDFYEDNNIDKEFEDNLRKIYIVYSEWELKFGSSIRCLKILQNGIKSMKKQVDKLSLYKSLIVNTIKIKGIEWSVAIFKEALENISVQIPGYIDELVDGFIKVQLKLGNLKYCRQILKYSAENVMEFNKNAQDREKMWELYKEFELENGDENTFKEVLRLKLYLESLYPLKQPNPIVTNTVSKQVGFVVSSSGPKTTTFTMGDDNENTDKPNSESFPVNNDAISLDMDLDMDSSDTE